MKKVFLISSMKNQPTAECLARGFLSAGAELLIATDVGSLGLPGASLVERDFEAFEFCELHEFKPDLVFFIEGGTMKLFPRGLERFSCPTAWYAIDNHTGIKKHLQIAPLFDLTFAAQKAFLGSFEALGLVARWLPLGLDLPLLPKEELPKIYDLALVGSLDPGAHPERVAMVARLKEAFPNSFFGRASMEELYLIYAQTRLVFNKSIQGDLNMRYFEALGSGALLLTDPIKDSGREELFTPEVEYFDYQESELVQRARDLLEHWDKLAPAASLAAKKLRTKHSYKARAQSILDLTPQIQRRRSSGLGLELGAYLALENRAASLKAMVRVLEQMAGTDSKKQLLFTPAKVSLKALAKLFEGLEI
ncbi:MAG: hypothetical protein A2508_05050 [Candidatus Lambdaproteobacteria bacterium RIFOXYD12_FULL_49_8]|uniref:Spore protein YkvP/CgeB glycosyl transferase-like domain-containing protein n=1 Tax=Candidatus Lambdaproteobacteria bacterium RIFOXYD2_FULL_50_16 TaxID=1817772 RepID=A0A1F6GB35_9PROT|nr:MAG: hypothetical protein A2527_07360 [Candidatus Lambdaproteobacteria bacterium RIFOXYD2_FULL_50_16]OGG96208.1 MAG: hypothetical protein A2508_05050 [Candidatus Lambdaproteobacteria bacterium RIFOXYD12_FULL_49_8]